MTTIPSVTTNLPMSADRPTIEADAGTIKCQVYSRGWAPGGGFVFTYCEALQRCVISWSVADRWHTRRMLRVCARHGAEFAAQYGLAAVIAVPRATVTAEGGRGARENGRVPSAEGPILARKTVTGVPEKNQEAATCPTDPRSAVPASTRTTTDAPASSTTDLNALARTATSDDDPFADDADSPYDRIREGTAG